MLDLSPWISLFKPRVDVRLNIGTKTIGAQHEPKCRPQKSEGVGEAQHQGGIFVRGIVILQKRKIKSTETLSHWQYLTGNANKIGRKKTFYYS